MLYLIPHSKFPYASDLCMWHVHFWLQWLSSSTCLLVASTVDHQCGSALFCHWTSWPCIHKSFSVGMDIASMFLCMMLRTLLPMAAHDDPRFTITDQCWSHHFQTGTATVSGHRLPPPCWQNLQKHLPATYLPHHCIVRTTLLVHSQVIALWANYFY